MTDEIHGESQAKFVRQIEILQSSYSIASDNWREIEKSLLAQVARLEKESAESSKREGDLRRKARENSGRCKELELEILETSSDIGNFKKQRDLAREASSALEHALDAARQEIDVLARASSAIERAAEVKEESSKTDKNVQGCFKPDYSAETSNQRPGQFSTRESPTDEQPTQVSLTEIPIDLVTTPATPERTLNDMFSVSTAAAGPSVQLVERLSASVRRLESEKATLQAEVDRLMAERSEAMGQVVALMEELETKRDADAKAAELKEEMEDTRVKLTTTLEMLGEKSELIDELRHDIVDMKEIYRSSLENTIK